MRIAAPGRTIHMLLALDTATATASLALYDGQTDTLVAEWT